MGSLVFKWRLTWNVCVITGTSLIHCSTMLASRDLIFSIKFKIHWGWDITEQLSPCFLTENSLLPPRKTVPGLELLSWDNSKVNQGPFPGFVRHVPISQRHGLVVPSTTGSHRCLLPACILHRLPVFSAQSELYFLQIFLRPVSSLLSPDGVGKATLSYILWQMN